MTQRSNWRSGLPSNAPWFRAAVISWDRWQILLDVLRKQSDHCHDRAAQPPGKEKK